MLRHCGATVADRNLLESPMAKRDPSLALAGRQEVYAFERSLGLPPAEACRRAGGKVENGQATKWEHSRRVAARIGYLRKLGHTDEMIAAKRQRIEQRLELAAFGNIFDFATISEAKKPVIDWGLVAQSPYAVIIESFKFDKDSGLLTDFDRESALQALAQLRDMHGFKAPTKTAFTDPSGDNAASIILEIVKFSDVAAPGSTGSDQAAA